MEFIEIKNLLDSADRVEAEGSTYRWKAAEAIVQKLDEGLTQVKIAKELGKSEPFVTYYVRVWREKDTHGLEDFQAAYRWAQANPKNPRPRSEQIVRPAPGRDTPVNTESEVDPGVYEYPEGYVQPEERTEAERKADRAIIEEQLEPLRQSIKDLPRSFGARTFIGTLKECADDLDEILGDPRTLEVFVTDEDIQEAYEWIGELTNRLMQIEMHRANLKQQ